MPLDECTAFEELLTAAQAGDVLRPREQLGQAVEVMSPLVHQDESHPAR